MSAADEAVIMAEGYRDRPSLIFVIMQFGNEADGGLESVSLVVEGLRSFRPVVVTQIESRFSERWRRAGADVRIWPLSTAMGTQLRGGALGQRVSRVMDLAVLNWNMARLVRQTGSAVVHCNDLFGFLHSGFGARGAGARVVLNVRDASPRKRYGAAWRIGYALCDATIVLSHDMMRVLANGLGIGGPSSRIVPIYSAVEFPVAHKPEPERGALRLQLGIPDELGAVGFIGAFSPRKGQLRLIQEGLPALRRICRGWHIYFLGDFDPARDGYSRACRDAVDATDLSSVVSFVGYRADVAAWYRALDVAVVASEREGLARSMIESLAAGTPVVSFDVCSAREILEGHRCGFVVPHGDYGALAERIERLLHNPPLRKALGTAGAAVARTLFDPADVVRDYEAVYARVGGAVAVAREISVP